MPQPNKGSAGKPHTAAPIVDKKGAKSDPRVMTGVHVKGIKGKGTK